MLRERRDHPIVIEPALSQRDLAGWAGVSDRSAAAALQQFRSEGLVRTGRLRMEILDLEALEAHTNHRPRVCRPRQPDPIPVSDTTMSSG